MNSSALQHGLEGYNWICISKNLSLTRGFLIREACVDIQNLLSEKEIDIQNIGYCSIDAIDAYSFTYASTRCVHHEAYLEGSPS